MVEDVTRLSAHHGIRATMEPMGWERRLKEMLLAGGALAAAACSSSSSSAVTGGSDASMPGSDAGTDAEWSDVTGGGVDDASGCCNAAPDPCCPYLYCEASITPTCSQEMACEAEGGVWSYGGCSTSQEAGQDGGVPGDADTTGGDAHD